MTAQSHVLVVGSINVDLVVHAGRLPGPGETVAGGRLERTGGGKGANQAVAAARSRAAVRLIGAVGDDDFGAGALDELRAEGVDVSAVLRLEGVPTGVALIVVDRAGNNQIAVASGANHELSGADVRSAAGGAATGTRSAGLNAPSGDASSERSEPADAPPRGPRAERPACMLASFELRDEAVLAAAELAHEAGCPLVANPAPARPLPDRLCELRPLLTPNQTEAAQLTGEDDPLASGHALAARTGAPVVVTVGENGALVIGDAGSTHVPAPRVRAVDTTGAGDAFNGVLAAQLARGAGLRAAVAVAVDAAAQSVTRAGARG